MVSGVTGVRTACPTRFSPVHDRILDSQCDLVCLADTSRQVPRLATECRCAPSTTPHLDPSFHPRRRISSTPSTDACPPRESNVVMPRCRRTSARSRGGLDAVD